MSMDTDAAKSPAASIVVGTPNDPLFGQQWYLRNTGQNGGRPGIDVNVLPVWRDYTGQGVDVAIIDSGVAYEHPDLAPNYDASRDANVFLGSGDGGPIFGDAHGTAVAGLIAAGADNGIGMAGVAPDATISSFPWGPGGSGDGLADAATLIRAASGFDILNLSVTPNTAPTQTGFAALANATETYLATGRDGLGGLVFWAARNGRVGEQGGDQTAGARHLNIRGDMPVAAVGPGGEHADYSSWGPSVFVSAPSAQTAAGGIVTTDIPGTAGYDPGDYTTAFGGTSAATPLASGVAALILDANPELGWRDVQDILALTSRQVDRADPDWTINEADFANGGGLHFSRDYGFGLIDARAAVRLAESWEGAPGTSANDAVYTATTPQAATIAQGELRQTITLAAPADFDLQHVELFLDLDHASLADVTVRLTSPSGTTAVVFETPDNAVTTSLDLGRPFLLHNFWGEEAAGTWTLSVVDEASANDGALRAWRISGWGEAPSADDVYVFTDEYRTLAADASRRLLSDSGGVDTLNAAAVSAGLLLDLSPGGACRIAGQTLRLTSGTLVENAWCGDGNDLARGNAAANSLHGGRGLDLLRGQAGADRLWGDLGRDALFGDAGNDTLEGGAADDVLEGGVGVDTAVFDGDLADFAGVRQGTRLVTAREGSGSDLGRDVLHSIELLRFDDVLFDVRTGRTTPIEATAQGDWLLA